MKREQPGALRDVIGSRNVADYTPEIVETR